MELKKLLWQLITYQIEFSEFSSGFPGKCGKLGLFKVNSISIKSKFNRLNIKFTTKTSPVMAPVLGLGPGFVKSKPSYCKDVFVSYLLHNDLNKKKKKNIITFTIETVTVNFSTAPPYDQNVCKHVYRIRQNITYTILRVIQVFITWCTDMIYG